jgi:hypothetical protein
MKNTLITISALLLAAFAAQAALTPPAGLAVYKDWNFDGDGLAGGTVDSGATKSDWRDNKWRDVRDGGDDSVYPDTGGFLVSSAILQDDANLFTTAAGDGTLTYQSPTIGTTANMFLDLGGDRSSGFFEMRAMSEAIGGGTGLYSAKFTFRDSGGSDLFVLNLRKDTELRWTTSSGDLAFAGETANAFNNYQIAWDNGLVSLFWDDEANGGANATTYLNEGYLGGSVADVAEIQFEVNTSGEAGKVTIDSLSVNVIPEPATLGMVGMAAATMLFIRRRLIV